VDFEGITATSCGAANAAVLAFGMTVGGRSGAKKALKDFWLRVSHAALASPGSLRSTTGSLYNHGL
jgi:NTE family protein